MKKQNVNQKVNVKSVIIGIVSAVITSILLSMLSATILLGGKIETNLTGVITSTIHMVSIALVCLLWRVVQKERNLLSVVLTGVGYLVCVLVGNMLIFSSGIHNAIMSIGGIVLGMLVGLLQFQQRNSAALRKRKMKIR